MADKDDKKKMPKAMPFGKPGKKMPMMPKSKPAKGGY